MSNESSRFATRPEVRVPELQHSETQAALADIMAGDREGAFRRLFDSVMSQARLEGCIHPDKPETPTLREILRQPAS